MRREKGFVLTTTPYPMATAMRRVTTVGTVRVNHRLRYIANALACPHVGLEETDDGTWSRPFNDVLPAKRAERDGIRRG